MTTAYSTNLGLALPVEGELSGTWGDMVNNGITQYSDIAIAGTQTISGTQTAVTLSLTNGNSSATNIAQVGSGSTGSAQFAIINCTGAPVSTLTITAPASSRQYIVINATSTSQSVKVVGAGPTTGVTIVSGEKAHIAWNGSDYVKVATSTAGSGTVTSVAQSFTGGLISVGGSPITSSGTLALTVAGTSGGVPYFSSGTTWASSAALAANALVVGGGAGAAPSTITTGTGVVTALGVNTGSSGAFVVNGGALGTPSSGTLTNATGLPVSTGVSGLGTGVATALAVNTGSAGAVVVNGGALGTPSSGTLSSTTIDGTNPTGFKNIPYTTDKTTSYTLATTDVGKVIGVGAGGSIEIPNSTFAAGDAVLLFNNTSGDITITCTITTAYIAGTDADKASVTLATRGVANILFVSGTVCVITGNVS